MWTRLLDAWRWLRQRLSLRARRGWWPVGEVTPPAVPAALPRPQPCACATVVIPALNEAARIAEVVRYARGDPATAEVIVVDDSSIDETARLAAEAGATVLRSTMLGKGASMRDGALVARHELVVYLDGDLSGLQPGIVTELCRPLVDEEADFVKARFGRSGGRVTELTAKPMLKVFFPELATVAQPLGGLIAARRRLLQQLEFEDGYGVDVALLIDAHRNGARIAEVDIGSLEHDSQPLPDLALMANEVSRVIFGRARAAGRLHVDQIAAMYETQRQAAASLDVVLSRRRGRTRVLLLDLDGTLTRERFVVQLARTTGVEHEARRCLEDPSLDAAARASAVASLFRFVHRRQFERVAHDMPLRDGAIECVNALRRAGFMVGVISDSWFVASEILRRRVFADFALSNLLHFDGEVCTGVVTVNPAFLPPRTVASSIACKSHVVHRLRADPSAPPLGEVWVVGHDLADLALLRQADRAFVIDPKSPDVARDCGATVLDSFADLSRQLAEPASSRPLAPSTGLA